MSKVENRKHKGKQRDSSSQTVFISVILGVPEMLSALLKGSKAVLGTCEQGASVMNTATRQLTLLIYVATTDHGYHLGIVGV